MSASVLVDGILAGAPVQVTHLALDRLRQGVTIGNRVADGAVPVIGDDVDFGAYAQVLGGVRIGNGCHIGAMSVVLCDVPDGATAVGVPARVILKPDLQHQAAAAATRTNKEDREELV